MRWTTETRQEHEDRMAVWRSWFAWYPVRLMSDKCVWLEWVERRSIYLNATSVWHSGCWIWEYR